MIRQLFIICSTFFLGFLVVLVSVHSAVSPVNELGAAGKVGFEQINFAEIGYTLPEVGAITPDSAFWLVNAAVDGIKVRLASSGVERANVYISHSDKRLVQSNYLLSVGKYNHAVVVLNKAEMYLEHAYNSYLEASSSGENTSILSRKLMTASLVHSELINDSILYYPEESRPAVIESMDYSRRIFDILSNKLNASNNLKALVK